jgi:pyridoxine kinase
MLDKPYVSEGYDEAYVKDILVSLTSLGCKKAVLTGIGFTPDKLGCYGYDSETGNFWSDFNDKKPQSFHGTGDVFASACFASVMNGKSLLDASAFAADFVCDSIDATLNDEKPISYGVHFEKVIKKF